MNHPQRPLGSFETWQLGELRRLVSEQPAAEPASAFRRRRPRLRLAAGTAATGLAVGAAVGVPLMSGGGGPSAQAAPFEVEANDDGTVTARIYTYEDADGLEEQLEAYGVPAEVDYTAEQRWCDPDRGTEVDRRLNFDLESRTGLDGKGPVSFTVRPSDYGPRETLVISLGWTSNPAASYIDLQVIEGAVKPCVPEDLPAKYPGG